MSLALHPDVAWLHWDDADVVAMRLPEGEPITLTGTAAALFLDIADGLDPVAEALARWPEHADAVRAQTPAFLRDLLASGLIVGSPPADVEPAPPRRASDATREDVVEESGDGERRPYRVLFVCTANICRSAYADVAARAAGIDGVAFSSAGTHALVDHTIDPPMAAELSPGHPAAHHARQLTRENAAEADLIIALAARHRSYVLEEWPGLGRKTYVIGHVARELGRLPEEVTLEGLTEHLWANRQATPDDSVADPYGQGQAAAAACARTIDSRLAVILEGLQTLLRAEHL